MSSDRISIEHFNDSIIKRWSKDPDRNSEGRYFFDAAIEVYLQEYELHYGRCISGFDPNDTKQLARWLNKCVKDKMNGE